MGKWLEGNEAMVKEVVNFFQAQFHEDRVPTAFKVLHLAHGERTKSRSSEATNKRGGEAGCFCA